MHRYAAGLFTGTFRGWKYYSHDGATASYRANLETYPELGLSVAWLSNTSEFDNDTINVAEVVSDLFVPFKEPQTLVMSSSLFDVSKEKLNNYAGWYRNPRTGSRIRLWMQNDNLYGTQVGQLTPIAENMFRARNNIIEMRSKGFLFINGEKDSIYLTAVDSAKLDEKAMKEYAGEYYSEEAEVKFFVTIKNGKLFIQRKPSSEFQLTPTYKDGFDAPVGNLYFEREKNKITRMMISVGRARNVEFRKVK